MGLTPLGRKAAGEAGHRFFRFIRGGLDGHRYLGLEIGYGLRGKRFSRIGFGAGVKRGLSVSFAASNSCSASDNICSHSWWSLKGFSSMARAVTCVQDGIFFTGIGTDQVGLLLWYFFIF